jgi:hypothetical protein
MQRFLGLLLALVGAVGVLWGGYHILLGQSSARMELPFQVSVSALHVGLTGVLLLTLGLIWVRD